jgi:hypothetical protein
MHCFVLSGTLVLRKRGKLCTGLKHPGTCVFRLQATGATPGTEPGNAIRGFVIEAGATSTWEKASYEGKHYKNMIYVTLIA